MYSDNYKQQPILTWKKPQNNADSIPRGPRRLASCHGTCINFVKFLIIQGQDNVTINKPQELLVIIN